MLALILSLVLSGTAGLSGTVVDQTGGVIAGAQVVVLDAQHHPTSQKTVTNQSGVFSFDNAALPVEIEVSLDGFITKRAVVTTSPVRLQLEIAYMIVDGPDVYGRQGMGWRDQMTGATTLTRTDLDRIPAMTPDESLKVISGFSLFRRSSSRASNPTTHGVTMRGLSASGSSRALVVFSGIPLNDGFGGWITWERLPAAAIDGVTVQRGPMGDVFGSDALGGAITLVSPANPSRSGVVSLEAASLDTRTLAASGGGASKQALVFGAASWFDSSGFVPVEPATRGPVDTPMDTTWTNAFGKAMFGRDRRLTLSGWGGRDDRGNGTALQRNDSHGGTGSALFESMFDQFSVAASAAESVNRYEQTFTAVATGRATEKLTSTQQIDTDVFRASMSVGRSLYVGGHSGVFQIRGALSRTTSAFDDIRPTTTLSSNLVDNNQSVSAQLAFNPADRLTLMGGVRGEWRAAGASGGAAASDDKSAVIGRGGLSVAISREVSVRAAAATSHRWPTLNELVRDFSAGTVTTVANPNLLPERARSVEAGIDLRHDRQQVGLTVFDAVVNDAIANVTTSVVGSAITRQRRNAGEAHSHGLEFDTELNASIFRLRASVTALDAKFRNSQEAALEGKWLPQVPATSIVVTGDALLPKHHVASIVIHNTSSQFDDDRNTPAFRLTAATQVDAQLGGAIRHASWYVAVENIGDARIETGRSGSTTLPLVTIAQSRAVRVGVTLKLPQK
jgi:outer membrane cobalamin receptor